MWMTSCLDFAINIIIEKPEHVHVEFDNASVEFMSINMCNVHIRMNVNLFSVYIKALADFRKLRNRGDKKFFLFKTP